MGAMGVMAMSWLKSQFGTTVAEARKVCAAKVFGRVDIGMVLTLCAVAAFLLFLPDLANAQSGSAPWESGVCRFMKAVTGKWIGWVAVIAVVIAAVLYGVGESNQTFQTALRIVAGFSIALGAAAAVAFFFPGVVVPSDCNSAGAAF